jgi:hypothetical protein
MSLPGLLLLSTLPYHNLQTSLVGLDSSGHRRKRKVHACDGKSIFRLPPRSTWVLPALICLVERVVCRQPLLSHRSVEKLT